MEKYKVKETLRQEFGMSDGKMRNEYLLERLTSNDFIGMPYHIVATFTVESGKYEPQVGDILLASLVLTTTIGAGYVGQSVMLIDDNYAVLKTEQHK